MTAKKVATFINGDRRVHYVEMPDNEIDEYLEQLAKEIERCRHEAKVVEKARPGFINDNR